MARTLVRPGGRSERIQLAVYQAVRELLAERPGGELTVAMIASRADVPPSTIYRRWQTLQQLLTDVMRERFLPVSVPVETGSLKHDLEVWFAQLVDAISSGPGHAMLRERLSDVRIARIAAAYARQNLVCLCNRCATRGEPVPVPDRLVDLLVAPAIYRIFFAGQTMSKAYQVELIENALKSPMLMEPFESQSSICGHGLHENAGQ